MIVYCRCLLQLIAILSTFIAKYCNMIATAGKKVNKILSRYRLLVIKENGAIKGPAAVPQRVVLPQANRKSVSMFFLMHGLCFASWASRIPTIQSTLKLSATDLGTILFALPAGFFISLPFAGRLIAKVGSKHAVILSSILYSLSLVSIGFVSSSVQVATSLLSFGFFANMLNISMNTQAVAVEESYKKRMMATFHGLWSLAGFAGAAIGTWMIGQVVPPLQHFIFICIIFLITIIICASRLVEKDKRNVEKNPILALPDKSLLGLGLIAFCSMMVEGAMFDWSGIYFANVVQANSDLAGTGYTTFMIAMAGMRFLADGLSGSFGLKRILQASGILSTIGLLLAVIQPQLIPALIGFLLIGMGVSSVVPMVYSAAGKSKTMAAGTALTAVSSLGFVGFLIGPPIIGYIADASSLKGSFLALTFYTFLVFCQARITRAIKGKICRMNPAEQNIIC
jgi:MFS family permease